MEYGILHPFDIVVAVYGKTFEKFALSEEERLKGGEKQAFAEASRTAQKVILILIRQSIDKLRLVDIEIILGSYL